MMTTVHELARRRQSAVCSIMVAPVSMLTGY
jgi:hypothetical protein